MTYTKTQYEEMARKFNLLGLTGKLLLIKNHSDIFYLEIDGDNFFLRLHQENAMFEEFDLFFNFPQNLEEQHFKELFKLIDIQLKW